MALTSPQLTGLILGILLPFFIIALATLLIHRYRRRTNPYHSSPKRNPEAVDSPPRFTLAPDDEADALRRGTVRRQTGQPQTFTDWVRESNLDEESGRVAGGVLARGERWPSLEHGPGPIIITQYPSAPNVSPATADAPPDKNGNMEDTTGANEGRRTGSVDESSLREAVLGVDSKKDNSMRKENEEKTKEGDKVEEAKAKYEDQVGKTRGYSGAWP